MSDLTLSSLVSEWITYYKKKESAHLPFEIKNESIHNFSPPSQPQSQTFKSPLKEPKPPVAIKPVVPKKNPESIRPQEDTAMATFFKNHFPEMKVIQPIAPLVVLTPVTTGPIKDFLKKLSGALTQHVTFSQCLPFSPHLLSHPHVKLVIAPCDLLSSHLKIPIHPHQLTGTTPACFALASPKDYLTNNDLKRTLWQQLKHPSLLKLF